VDSWASRGKVRERRNRTASGLGKRCYTVRSGGSNSLAAGRATGKC
jgi:hypothetical protein